MSVQTEYRKLLAQYAPQPIRNQQDHRRARRQLEELMTPHPGAARSLLTEVLSTLIEQYESRVLPVPKVSPAELLAHLLESRKLSRADLARQTRISAATLSSVLTEKRGISKSNALILGKFFGISPASFLVEADPASQFQPA